MVFKRSRYKRLLLGSSRDTFGALLFYLKEKMALDGGSNKVSIGSSLSVNTIRLMDSNTSEAT